VDVGHESADGDDEGVVRGLRAAKQVSDWLSVGTRAADGAVDDVFVVAPFVEVFAKLDGVREVAWVAVDSLRGGNVDAVFQVLGGSVGCVDGGCGRVARCCCVVEEIALVGL